MTDIVGQTLGQIPCSMSGRPIGQWAVGWIMCKNLGVALLLAPRCTEVSRTWQCINDAVTMANCCVNSSAGWFVPDCNQLRAVMTAHFVGPCPAGTVGDFYVPYGRYYSDSYFSSSTSGFDAYAFYGCYSFLGVSCVDSNGPCVFNVRAIRCVTY